MNEEVMNNFYGKQNRADIAKSLGICPECFEKAFAHLIKCNFIRLDEDSNQTTFYDADAERFVTHNNLADSNHSES